MKLLVMYQTSPPASPGEILPTMYDLPSDNPEEPGLPDEFHLLQPELLRQTFRPPNYPANNIFTASDLNLYYDGRHPQWYKRPDWFAVLGVSRLFNDSELRLSYVTWQESVYPFVVVELLSPGTEKEESKKVNCLLIFFQKLAHFLPMHYSIQNFFPIKVKKCLPT